MTTRQQAFRALLDSGEPFIVPDCYSALSARIVEHVGFASAYMGGHATGMMHYAIPDAGALTPTEMIEQAGRVAEAISIPLIVDADQAGESVADVHRTVRRFEYVGVAGIHMEDETTPKHTTYDGPLMSIVDMQARISAAVEARRDPDFVVIARCDEFHAAWGGGTGSLEETIRRGLAYAEAGADVFLPTFATAEQAAQVAAEVPLPIAGYGPLLPGQTFSLFTGWGTASAARVHYELATHLRDHGDVPDGSFELPDKEILIDEVGTDQLVQTWATRTGRPVRLRD